jgi:hypothetical protein
MNIEVSYPGITQTFVPRSIRIERILGDPKHVRLLENFWFYSACLGRWCCIEKGFVYDEESVPILSGTNPEAGAIHDYFSRSNSDPVVDKKTAARIYEEFQAYYDEMESGNWLNRAWDWIRRTVKSAVVAVTPWPRYFHKYRVEATYEEIAG